MIFPALFFRHTSWPITVGRLPDGGPPAAGRPGSGYAANMSEGSPDLPDEPPLPTWVQQLRRLQEEEAIKWAGRQFDEDGCHDEDACRVCLEGKAVTNACRCAQCCRRLIIEALVEDAKGEPKIRELGSPILGPP